jgi:hypothetical protein
MPAGDANDDGGGPAGDALGEGAVVPIDRLPCERVIPLRAADLTRRLRADPRLSPTESDLLGRLGRLLAAVFHHEFHAWLVELKDLYAPLDPDSDCLNLRGGTLVRDQEVDDTFLKTFEDALIRANYRALDLAVIEQAIESPNELGLNYLPNFALFEHLKIYVRGRTRVKRHVRRVKKLFRRHTIEYDAYQRMVLALKFKEGPKLGPFARSDVLYLRLFKDVPHVDMEMHLPEQGTKVVMRTIDKAQIASPLMVGLPTFAFKLLTATLISPFALGAVMIAPISAGLNSFFGFQRAKQKHLHHMIRNLYYLTLANNASVIETLIQSAEEEEYKEALLGYFFLWLESEGELWDRRRLDRRVEAFLKDVTGLEIDFEIADALRKLVGLGLVEARPDGRLRARPIEAALQILDARWDDAFRYNVPADVKQ